MNELKERIIACMDEAQFLDILGLDITDLVEKFAEEIEENVEDFWAAVQ